MSNRRKAGLKNRTVAYIAAGIVHLVIIGAMVFNYTENRETVDAFDAEKVDTINASVINESDIKDQQEKLKQQDRERERQKREKEKRERERLDKLKQEAEKEKLEIEKLKDQQKKEKEKAAELEREREAIALKKKKEEKEAADRKKKADAERKKKAEADKKRKAKAAEEKRIRDAEDAKRRARLEAELANEEAERQRQAADQVAKERSATVMSLYSSRIEQAIKDRWRVAPGTEAWRVVKVNIKLSPSGDVQSVRVINSSGLPDFDRSVETAILQASPLPFPSQEEDATAHQQLQNLNINLKK